MRVPKAPEPAEQRTRRDLNSDLQLAANLLEFPEWGDDPMDTQPVSQWKEEERSILLSRFKHFFQHIVFDWERYTPGSMVLLGRRLFKELNIPYTATQVEVLQLYKQFLIETYPDSALDNEDLIKRIARIKKDMEAWRLMCNPLLRERHLKLNGPQWERYKQYHSYEASMESMRAVGESEESVPVPAPASLPIRKEYNKAYALTRLSDVEKDPNVTKLLAAIGQYSARVKLVAVPVKIEEVPRKPSGPLPAASKDRGPLPPIPKLVVIKPAVVVAPPPAPRPIKKLAAPAPLPKPIVESKPLPIPPVPAPVAAPVSDLPTQNTPSSKYEPEEADETSETSPSIFQRLMGQKWFVPSLGAAAAGLIAAYAVVQLYNRNSGDLNEHAFNPIAAVTPEPLPPPSPEENKVKALPENPVVAEQIDWATEWEKERGKVFSKFFAFCKPFEKDFPNLKHEAPSKVTEKGVYMSFEFSTPQKPEPKTFEMKAELGVEVTQAEVDEFATAHNIDKEEAFKYLGYKDINGRVEKELDAKKEEILKSLLKGAPDKVVEAGSPKPETVQLIFGTDDQNIPLAELNHSGATEGSEYTTSGWGPLGFDVSRAKDVTWQSQWTADGAVAAIVVVCKKGEVVLPANGLSLGSQKPTWPTSHDLQTLKINKPFQLTVPSFSAACKNSTGVRPLVLEILRTRK